MLIHVTVQQYAHALRDYTSAQLAVVAWKRSVAWTADEVAKYDECHVKLIAHCKKVLAKLRDEYADRDLSKEEKKRRVDATAVLATKAEQIHKWLQKRQRTRRRLPFANTSAADIKWPSAAETADASQRRASIDTRMSVSALIRADYAKRAVNVSHIPVDDVRRLIAQEIYANEFNVDHIRRADETVARAFMAYAAERWPENDDREANGEKADEPVNSESGQLQK